jgi:hypothetical protein
MNNIEQLKQIIENAPNWADLVTDELLASDVTYYGDQGDNVAFKLDMSFVEPKMQAMRVNNIPTHNIRSLHDIKTIVEQAEEIERLKQENKQRSLLSANLHNFLFNHASSIPDGLFYELRGMLREFTPEQ